MLLPRGFESPEWVFIFRFCLKFLYFRNRMPQRECAFRIHIHAVQMLFFPQVMFVSLPQLLWIKQILLCSFPMQKIKFSSSLFDNLGNTWFQLYIGAWVKDSHQPKLQVLFPKPGSQPRRSKSPSKYSWAPVISASLHHNSGFELRLIQLGIFLSFFL